MASLLSYNNLVIHGKQFEILMQQFRFLVSRAQGLSLKNHKALDVYVSMVASGKGSNLKSKVTTNTIRTTDGNVLWDEHCEL